MTKKAKVVKYWACYVNGTNKIADTWNGLAVFNKKVHALMFSDMVINTTPKEVKIEVVNDK